MNRLVLNDAQLFNVSSICHFIYFIGTLFRYYDHNKLNLMEVRETAGSFDLIFKKFVTCVAVPCLVPTAVYCCVVMVQVWKFCVQIH